MPFNLRFSTRIGGRDPGTSTKVQSYMLAVRKRGNNQSHLTYAQKTPVFPTLDERGENTGRMCRNLT